MNRITPTLSAFVICFLLLGNDIAQAQRPARSPMQPTTFTALPKSLSQLLDEGWTIQSNAGAEGEVLILQSGRKWVRCELDGNELRLRIAPNVVSDCRALN